MTEESTLREVYQIVYDRFKNVALMNGCTEDCANRIAAKGAVENTQKWWRRQYEY